METALAVGISSVRLYPSSHKSTVLIDSLVDVTPATQPDNSAGVFWKVEDCYGYFARMLEKSGSEGCHNGVGSGIGSAKVGGDSSLADTEFKVTIVTREA